MSNAIWTAIGSVLAIIIGLWKYFSRKAKYRRDQAEKAKEDLNNANTNNDPGSFLDAFNRVRK